MKTSTLCFLVAASTVTAFSTVNVQKSYARFSVAMRSASINDNEGALDRKDFFNSVVGTTTAVVALSFTQAEPAQARGRATLEQAVQKYGPRIRNGGAFYASDLRSLVAKNDWAGIKAALQEPPKRKKEDLVKADSGVAARARQAGGFSDARVLVAADLFAAAFSDNSVSPKTKKMQASVVKLREVVEEMQKVAAQALGEDTGGFLGLGKKKYSEAELSKQIKVLYVEGGNAWNEYILATNDELPLWADKFEFIK